MKHRADHHDPDLFNQPPDPRFGGRTYEPIHDKVRLTSALEKVIELMQDGKPRTLAMIAAYAGCSESGASARLRDMRKGPFQAKYGVWKVESKRVEGGLWMYSISRG